MTAFKIAQTKKKMSFVFHIISAYANAFEPPFSSKCAQNPSEFHPRVQASMIDSYRHTVNTAHSSAGLSSSSLNGYPQTERGSLKLLPQREKTLARCTYVPHAVVTQEKRLFRSKITELEQALHRRLAHTATNLLYRFLASLANTLTRDTPYFPGVSKQTRENTYPSQPHASTIVNRDPTPECRSITLPRYVRPVKHIDPGNVCLWRTTSPHLQHQNPAAFPGLATVCQTRLQL